MRLAVRIEMSLGTRAIARGAVAHLMNMKAVFAAGLEPPHDRHHTNLVSDLFKRDLAEGLVAFRG
jgi:hypothetical protein